MASIFRFGTVLSLGLVSLTAACGSDDSSGTETASLTAQQACLRDHTDQGRMELGGRTCQVCGANRHDWSGSVSASGVIELPQAEFGLAIDLDLVAVRLTDRTGGYVEFEHVAAGTACGGTQSWKFDDDDAPTTVTLCNGDAAAQVSGAVYVDLLVGCDVSQTSSALINPQWDDEEGADGADTSSDDSGSEDEIQLDDDDADTDDDVDDDDDDDDDDDTDDGCGTSVCGSCSTVTCGSCATATCGSCGTIACGDGGVLIGGGVQLEGSIQIGGSVEIGGSISGSAEAEADADIQADAEASGGASISVSISGEIDAEGNASGCSCLWNILFSDNGCSLT